MKTHFYITRTKQLRMQSTPPGTLGSDLGVETVPDNTANAVLAAQEVEMKTWVIPEKMLDQSKRIKELEDMLFARGAMEEAPCFCCGYNGPGYYQPDTHPCAKRHHKLTAIRTKADELEQSK